MQDASPAGQLAIYRTLFDSLHDSVLLIDGERTLFHVNQRFCAAAGQERTALVGRPVTILDQYVTPETFGEFEAAVEDVLDGDSAEQRVELEAASPLEGDVVIECRITGIQFLDTEGAVVVIRDLTEKIERTDALALKGEQLAVVNRVLRHDIRNDMNIVLGWCDALEELIDSPEAIEYTTRIRRHSAHVVELTQAARELVDAIEAEWEMDLEPVALDRTIRREVELIDRQYPEATVEVAETLPAVEVLANEFLGSVVSNLVRNGITHNHRATPTVRVSVTVSDDRVTLRVADDGPGIPESMRDTVSKLGEKGPDSSGTGIGLYLVASLVDAYGGAVDIAANEPAGTIVTVDLQRV